MLRRVLCATCALATLAIATPASADETPVEYYRHQSISLTAGMDFFSFAAPGQWTGLATEFGNTSAVGVVGLGASARGVFSGVTVGAEFGVLYYNGLTQNAILYPGFSVGYAIPLMDRLALTPMFHAIFAAPTGGVGASTTIQLDGEVGLEIFLGKHGFIEPVISMGDLHDTGVPTSQDAFIFGVGYRLGVTF